MRTVNEILDRFELEYVPKLSPRTQKDYARHFIVLRKEFGEKDAEKLVPTDFDAFMNVAKGKIQRNRQLTVLSSAFTQAVWWKLLQHNVCMQVLRHRGKPRNRYVATDEFEAFKAFVGRRGRSKRLCLAMDLALNTGMIQGELLELRWSDVSATDRTISYRGFRLGKRVTIPITSKLRSLLEECRRLPNQCEYVMSQRDGRRYTSEGFRAVFQRGMQKWQRAGNKRFTFQDLHSKWEQDRARV
jgi:integrase